MMESYSSEPGTVHPETMFQGEPEQHTHEFVETWSIARTYNIWLQLQRKKQKPNARAYTFLIYRNTSNVFKRWSGLSTLTRWRIVISLHDRV